MNCKLNIKQVPIVFLFLCFISQYNTHAITTYNYQEDPEVVIIGKNMRHVLFVFLLDNDNVMIYRIDSNPNKGSASVRRMKVEDLLFGSDFSSYHRYSAKELKKLSQRSKGFYRIFTIIDPLFFEKMNKDKMTMLDNYIDKKLGIK